MDQAVPSFFGEMNIDKFFYVLDLIKAKGVYVEGTSDIEPFLSYQFVLDNDNIFIEIIVGKDAE